MNDHEPRPYYDDEDDDTQEIPTVCPPHDWSTPWLVKRVGSRELYCRRCNICGRTQSYLTWMGMDWKDD